MRMFSLVWLFSLYVLHGVSLNLRDWASCNIVTPHRSSILQYQVSIFVSLPKLPDSLIASAGLYN
jgi:hypothetical protein